MNQPVPIRPAATVILTRDSAHGIEVLMMRRSHKAAFMGGAHVFPGGAVDPSDAGEQWLSHTSGMDAAAACSAAVSIAVGAEPCACLFFTDARQLSRARICSARG